MYATPSDAWLTAPYDEMADADDEYSRYKDEYLDSDNYQEHLGEWLDENSERTEKDFLDLPRFYEYVYSYMSMRKESALDRAMGY